MHDSGFRFCIPAILALGTFAAIANADWTSWRGPEGNGSTKVGTYPSEIDDSTILWRTPLPGKGCSTPIVLNESIYLTAPVDGRDAILSFNSMGKEQWKTTFEPEAAGRHRNGSGCNASPVTDGDGVFAYFKSGMLAAVEIDGTVRWKTNLVERFGKDERFWDHGTSPVLTEKHVIMARMHAGDSWLAAFDKASGEIAWKVDRNYQVPKECDQCYTTPLVIRHNDREAILVWGAEHLTIHDPSDGKVLWSRGGYNPEQNKLWPAIATPVIVNNVAVICFGRNDKGSPLLYGVQLAGDGNSSGPNHIWRRDDVSSFVPTPVVYDGRVFIVRDKGEVDCLDPLTGKTIWSDRFPKNRSDYYASPIIAGGNLYAPREDGVMYVASVADGQFSRPTEFDFGEPVIGSPVPTDNRILIRGVNHLFCLAAPDATK